MRNRKSIVSLLDLSWQSVAYGVGVFGRRLVIVLATPVLTRHMAQDQYGIVSMLSAFAALAGIVVKSGLSPAMFRLYNDCRDDQARSLVLGSAQVLLLGQSAVALVVLLLFAKGVSRVLIGAPTCAGVIRLVGGYTFGQALITYGYNVLRIKTRPLATSAQQILEIAVELGLALLLVKAFGMGVTGYWLGYFAGSLMGLALTIWLIRDALIQPFSLFWVKEMALYAYPLVPSLISLWALKLLDRGLIGVLAGPRHVATYEVAYRIGMLVTGVIAPFGVAWPQFAFSVMDQRNARQIYQNVFSFMAAITLFAALAVMCFLEDILRLMAPSSYAAAGRVVPWIVLAQVAWGIYPVAIVGLHVRKRTGLISAINLVAGGLNILVNILLIPRMGIQGAGVATFSGYLTLLVAGYLVGQRFYPFPLDWTRLARLALAAIVCVVLSLGLSCLDTSPWTTRGLRLLALISFPLLLLAFSFVTPKECRDVCDTGFGLFQRNLLRMG